MSPSAPLGSRRPLGSSALRGLCAAWEDVQRTRLAATQRGQDWLADSLQPIEDRLGRQIGQALRRHTVWSWLSQFPGLGGVHVARLVALIDDPFRFPGRRCTAGHYLPARIDQAIVIEARSGPGGLAEARRVIDTSTGEPCPALTLDGACEGTLLLPRSGTGVRSLWHWAGLHVVDGRSPRKAKGKRADWNPVARTAVLMPGGIAEQIVRLRVPIYRERYDAAKERLTRERGGVDGERVVDPGSGPALRPFEVDAIARKIAAKAFLGDLLMEWKRLLRAEDADGIEYPAVPEQAEAAA